MMGFQGVFFQRVSLIALLAESRNDVKSTGKHVTPLGSLEVSYEGVFQSFGINAIAKSADATGSVCWGRDSSSGAPTADSRVVLLGVEVLKCVEISCCGGPPVDSSDKGEVEFLGISLIDGG